MGEIETIGPGTSAQLTATLGSGTYIFKCLMGSQAATASQPVQVTGAAAEQPGLRAVAVKPVTVAELTRPNKQYQAYAAGSSRTWRARSPRIQADLRRGDMAAAKQDWLTAQLDWERVGASYDSFGDLGLAVDGLPDGLPGGVNDKDFTGLHRLEYGLWHGQSAATLCRSPPRWPATSPTVRQNLTYRRPGRRPHEPAGPRARDPRGRAARPPVRALTTRAAAPRSRRPTPTSRSPGRSLATWRR